MRISKNEKGTIAKLRPMSEWDGTIHNEIRKQRNFNINGHLLTME